MLLFALGQGLIWVQANGQFLWPWFKKNPILVSILSGTIISYIVIHGTRLMVEHFDGKFWPGRFVGFSVGMIVFALLTWIFMNEGINTKTTISLVLAACLLAIQIFMK